MDITQTITLSLYQLYLNSDQIVAQSISGPPTTSVPSNIPQNNQYFKVAYTRTLNKNKILEIFLVVKPPILN